MKIAVLTCTTENRKWLYDITNKGKVSYCEKYNADYVFNDKIYYDKACSPGWNKIHYILDNLNKYDYVMWIDDDASFIKFDVDIFTYCIKLLQDKSILMCEDVNGLNSGIMFIKSDNFTKRLFSDIWQHRHLYTDDILESKGQRGLMEQPAIIDLVSIHNDKLVIGDGRVLNSYDSAVLNSPINQRTDESVILHIARGGEWKDQNKEFIANLFA